MLYRLYVYKTAAVTGEEPAVDFIHRAITENTASEWRGNHADSCMLPFDAHRVKADIEAATTADGGKRLCHVKILHTPQQKVDYLSVSTSYEAVRSVLLALYAIAAERELVLYDAELRRGIFPANLYDRAYVTMRNRAAQLNAKLQQMRDFIWSLRKLYAANGKYGKTCAYTVALRKNRDCTAEQSVRRVYLCLREALDGETLICANRCLTVRGEGYEIVYCIEVYKDNADKIGYIVDGGEARMDLLGRMPCAKAFEWLRRNGYASGDVEKRMCFTEMVQAYPNPADRFVHSVMISKALQKEKFDIRYSAHGQCGAEILFCAVPYGYAEEAAEVSVLKIGEESASFILPAVREFYPYMDARYYLTKNYIPWEMMSDILGKLKDVKEMLLHDTESETLLPYIRAFDLLWLAMQSGEAADDAALRRVRDNPVSFVRAHRYEIAHFYDLFIAWAEAQLAVYRDDSLMFGIEGP